MQHPKHDEIVLTLENEGVFYKAYTCRGFNSATARNQITNQVGRSFRHDSWLVSTFTKENAEEVREYLDERWNLKREGVNDMARETVVMKCSQVGLSSWIETHLGKPYGREQMEGDPEVRAVYQDKRQLVKYKRFAENYGRPYASGGAVTGRLPTRAVPEGAEMFIPMDYSAAELRVASNFGIESANANALAQYLNTPPKLEFEVTGFDSVALAKHLDSVSRNAILFGTPNPDGVYVNGEFFNSKQEYEQVMSLRNSPQVNVNIHCTKAPNMLKITTPTLVNGVDIHCLSDASLYEMISAQEAQIAKLDAINNKPGRLVAEIAKLQEGIDALVAAMNAKDGLVPVPVPETLTATVTESKPGA